MSKKKKDVPPNHIVFTIAATGGVMILRKVLATVWKKAIGKEPPTDVTDPMVSLHEAVAWAAATAVILETARFGIARATKQRQMAAAMAAQEESD